MERQIKAALSDFDFLNQLKSLSFLSTDALHELAITLNSANFKRGEVVLSEEGLAAGVHILLRGVAKITCLNPSGERATIALLAPGPIPQFVSLPVNRRHFRCEAHTDSRVGTVSWEQFDTITKDALRSDLRTFHENNFIQWHRFFAGSFDLRERLLFTLLQLCSIFGVKESRGTLLRVVLSHDELAGLVGASRPRVTDQIAEFEREHLLIRQGRQMIVCMDKLEGSINGLQLKTHETKMNDLLAGHGAQAQVPKVSRLYSPRLLGSAVNVNAPGQERFASPISRRAHSRFASV